jgi:hypothetical protein
MLAAGSFALDDKHYPSLKTTRARWRIKHGLYRYPGTVEKAKIVLNMIRGRQIWFIIVAFIVKFLYLDRLYHLAV